MIGSDQTNKSNALIKANGAWNPPSDFWTFLRWMEGDWIWFHLSVSRIPGCGPDAVRDKVGDRVFSYYP